jgi:hypothetical protein
LKGARLEKSLARNAWKLTSGVYGIPGSFFISFFIVRAFAFFHRT